MQQLKMQVLLHLYDFSILSITLCVMHMVFGVKGLTGI